MRGYHFEWVWSNTTASSRETLPSNFWNILLRNSSRRLHSGSRVISDIAPDLVSFCPRTCRWRARVCCLWLSLRSSTWAGQMRTQTVSCCPSSPELKLEKISWIGSLELFHGRRSSVTNLLEQCRNSNLTWALENLSIGTVSLMVSFQCGLLWW